MPTETEIKTRILTTALEQSLKFGISKVTMEELAEEMGMSKKTIYKYFPSKDALVRDLLNEQKKMHACECSKIMEQEGLNFVEKLKIILKYTGEQYSNWTPQFINDLRRNSPDIWKEIDQWRTKKIFDDFSTLVESGIHKRVFRQDVNKKILVMLYAGAVQHLINPEVLAQNSFSASKVYDNLIHIIFEGIFSEESRRKYNQTENLQDGLIALLFSHQQNNYEIFILSLSTVIC
jgi:AcrR family transcriptional regulator